MSTEKATIEINEETIQKAYQTLGIEISKAEGDEEDMDEEGDEEDDEKTKKKVKKSEQDELSSEDKIIKGISDSLNESFGEKFKATALLNKSLEDKLGEMNEKLEKAEQRIEELEETPTQRKSVTSFIEKAFQEDKDSGKKMLSLSQHRNEIQNLLIEKAGLGSDLLEKGVVDNFWNNEVQYYEATGSLHRGAFEKLYKDDNIQIVR